LHYRSGHDYFIKCRHITDQVRNEEQHPNGKGKKRRTALTGGTLKKRRTARQTERIAQKGGIEDEKI